MYFSDTSKRVFHNGYCCLKPCLTCDGIKYNNCLSCINQEYLLVNKVCKACNTIYDSDCLECDSTKCLSCKTKYYHTLTHSCYDPCPSLFIKKIEGGLNICKKCDTVYNTDCG